MNAIVGGARPGTQLLCKLMYACTALVGETEAERLKEHLRDRCTRVEHLTEHFGNLVCSALPSQPNFSDWPKKHGRRCELSPRAAQEVAPR